MELVSDKDRSTTISKDDVRKLWAMIETSKKKDLGFFQLCRDLKSLYKTGTQEELGGMPNSNKVVVNLAHAHIATVLPSIFFKEPTIVAQPTSPRYEGMEKIWSALLNNTNRKVGLKEAAKDVVRDALVYPEGWLKILSNKPADESNQTETESAETGKRGEVQWLSKGAPIYARVSPLQTIVDYRSTDRSLDNARFVVFVYAKDLEEIKADSRYKIPVDIDTKKLHGMSGDKLSITTGWIEPFHNHSDDSISPEDHDQYVYIYETWVYQLVGMKLKRQLICLLGGQDGLLSETPIRMETWEDVLGSEVKEYPFERLVYHKIPDSLPNSELGVWSSIHDAINWLTSRLVNLVEAEKPLYEYVPGQTHNEEAFKALFENSSSPRVLLPVKELGKTVAGIPNHTTPRDNYQLMNHLTDMARKVGGVSENRQGGGNFRTATESDNVEQGQQIKAHEKVDTTSDWFKKLFYKQISIIRSLIKDSGDTNFVFNIGGDTGAVKWLNFTDQDVDWVPEIHIEAHSFNKATREENVQKAMMAFNAGLQAYQLVPSIRIDILFKNILESLEISGTAKIVDSKQDHMILQAVEMVALLQGEEVEVDPNQDHQAHVEVIQMFLNSPNFEGVYQSNPSAVERLVAHMEEHLTILKQADAANKGGSSNPYDQGVSQQIPANQARQDSAIDRENLRPGAGGQR